MARNKYGRKNSPRRANGKSGQLMMVFGAFVVGYISANVYDFAQLSGWMGAHLAAQQTQKNVTKLHVQQAQLPKPKFEFYTLLANEQVTGSTAKPAITQATNHVQPVTNAQAIGAQTGGASQVANAMVPSPGTPMSPEAPVNLTVTQKLPLHAPLTIASATKIANSIESAKDAYLIQVGSFRNLREAERMKAALLMKGFDVKIATTSQQNISWFRVNIGPFASRAQALKAQIEFARSEHINGMIRRMNA